MGDLHIWIWLTCNLCHYTMWHLSARMEKMFIWGPSIYFEKSIFCLNERHDTWATIKMDGCVVCFIFRLPMNPQCLSLITLHYVSSSAGQPVPSLFVAPPCMLWARWHLSPASLVWTLGYIFHLSGMFWTILPAPIPHYHSLHCHEFTCFYSISIILVLGGRGSTGMWSSHQI